MEAAQSVFTDAAEEYGSLPAVKRHLEDWKQEHPSAYLDAYMSMNVAAVMAPFVRLELLQWDPIYGTNTGLARSVNRLVHLTVCMYWAVLLPVNYIL